MRFAILLAPMSLVACQQAEAPAGNVAAAANVSSNAAEPAPPSTEAPRAQPTAPDPAPIPASFRGIWAEGRAACAQLSHPSRLIISASVIRYPSFVLVGESTDLPTDSSFAVKGQNQRTGAPAEAHYSIEATGLILTDEAGGGAVRVKCG